MHHEDNVLRDIFSAVKSFMRQETVKMKRRNQHSTPDVVSKKELTSLLSKRQFSEKVVAQKAAKVEVTKSIKKEEQGMVMAKIASFETPAK